MVTAAAHCEPLCRSQPGLSGQLLAGSMALSRGAEHGVHCAAKGHSATAVCALTAGSPAWPPDCACGRGNRQPARLNPSQPLIWDSLLQVG